jgi:hypothetical protein
MLHLHDTASAVAVARARLRIERARTAAPIPPAVRKETLSKRHQQRPAPQPQSRAIGLQNLTSQLAHFKRIIFAQLKISVKLHI